MHVALNDCSVNNACHWDTDGHRHHHCNLCFNLWCPSESLVHYLTTCLPRCVPKQKLWGRVAQASIRFLSSNHKWREALIAITSFCLAPLPDFWGKERAWLRCVTSLPQNNNKYSINKAVNLKHSWWHNNRMITHRQTQTNNHTYQAVTVQHCNSRSRKPVLRLTLILMLTLRILLKVCMLPTITVQDKRPWFLPSLQHHCEIDWDWVGFNVPLGTGFTGQMTQPTVSKHWRK